MNIKWLVDNSMTKTVFVGFYCTQLARLTVNKDQKNTKVYLAMSCLLLCRTESCISKNFLISYHKLFSAKYSNNLSSSINMISCLG